MDNMIPVVSSVRTYNNQELQNATDSIRALGEQVKANMFAIAFTINRVNTERLFEQDGFRNVHEWTAEAFGYKKSMSYNMLKIGMIYVKSETLPDGSVVYSSNLPRPNNADDFNATQVARMLPLGWNTARQMVEDGIITSDMSANDISKIVKETNDSAEPDAPSTPDDVESHESSTESSDEPSTPLIESTEPKHVKRLAKVTTEDLIQELLYRGFTVNSPDGNTYTPD